MSSPTSFNRPTLNEALDAWKQLLAARGFATDLLWIFEENLCFEKAPRRAGRFSPRLSNQIHRRRPRTRWTSRSNILPKPTSASVFYRLGDSLRQIHLRSAVRSVV